MHSSGGRCLCRCSGCGSLSTSVVGVDRSVVGVMVMKTRRFTAWYISTSLSAVFFSFSLVQLMVRLRPHGRSSCIGPDDMVQATDVSVSFLVLGELGVPRSVPAPGGHRPSEVSPLDTRFRVQAENTGLTTGGFCSL